MSFRALAEKSHAAETRTIVHKYPEYLPAVDHRREPPRQKRNAPYPRQPTCPRWLAAEKSPAAEMARYVPAPAKCPHGLRAAPAHLPAGAYRRESPDHRNGGTRTRITDQANTLNAAVIARSVATWQSPGRENLLAYTDKILARGGSPSRNPPRQKRNATYPRQPTCPRWLTVEKSPAAETARYVSAPAHLPAGVPCRFTATVRSGEIRR